MVIKFESCFEAWYYYLIQDKDPVINRRTHYTLIRINYIFITLIETRSSLN